MVENTANIVSEKPTNQTVTFSWADWLVVKEHVKRERGRTFGGYVRELIRRDMAGTGIVQVDDASPAASSGAKLNKINELTDRSSTANTIVTEAEEWAALASVAAQNPSEVHKTLYRHFRFAMETLAGVACEVLSLDLKIPVRFAPDGTIKRPHDDPQSPMYADRGFSGTGSTGAGDHRRASGSEAGRHARTAKKRA